MIIGGKMNKFGRDALAETHDVLNGLRHFLSAVEKAANSDANAELRNIEKSLGVVAKQISEIAQLDAPKSSRRAPLFEQL